MESINEVREDFVDTVLDGFTKEELKLYSLFFDRLFENIKKAMERNEKL